MVLDVVVTDSKGTPVRGLDKQDFAVMEDGEPQRVLSCEANGFSPGMDYVPPALPAQPAGTYMNLPATPEKGPLYVILYDLVNMDSPDQMDTPEDHHQQMVARQQMMKFIASKPEGARFAVFVRSDGLHLVQGFTSDKALLYRALDPHSPGPHVPAVFLMGANFGRGDRLSSVGILHQIAMYLDGLPGRKNLIWVSSAFPLSLFANDTDGPSFEEQTKETLDLLAHNQIAVYPVDARGVPLEDSHAQVASSVHSDTVTSPTESGGGGSGGSGGGGIGVGSSPSQTSTFVQGSSAVVDSYNAMDGIARETGGRAFYGDNNVAAELLEATQDGGVYYTLTYAPTNRDYDGKLRHIRVEVPGKGYVLSYRRAYYGTAAPEAGAVESASVEMNGGEKSTAAAEPVKDSLSANMEYGAPEAHQLVFIVQAHSVGAPVEGTPEQMAQLATEPAYFKSRRKSATPKPLKPVPLQTDVFSFAIPIRQFKGENALDLEVAAGAFDADGQMMNGEVRLARKELEAAAAAGEQARFYRVEQELEVPVGAATVRVAVRDTVNDRVGAMEIKLPLPAAAAAAR